jgi:hypothetical protein
VGAAHTRDQQLQGKVDLGVLEFGIAALAMFARLVSWRVLPLSYALFATTSCLIVLSSGTTVSVWRHVYLIFPLFIVAARAGSVKTFDRAYLSVSLIGSGLQITILATSWAMVT